jgi:cardiolipin synthase
MQRMRNLPNLITLLRLCLVPVMAYYAAREEYAIALPIFLVAAISDFVDGYIARALKVVSRLGAALDPVADKLNMFVATVLLAWQGLLPLWLAAAIIGRDIVIVAGVIAYRLIFQPPDMKPTRLSKTNTFIEFGVLLVVMATAADWVDARAWLPALFVVTLVTVVASGVQYVWLGTRMAMAEHRRKREAPMRPSGR